MTNQTPLNPDALETGAKALFMRERKYHTPTLECPEPPNWEDLTETSMEHYRGNARAVIAVAQPVVTATIENFINQRPEYITALKGTSGTDDQGDYWRWSGGAEARRQLATMLGWTVPHEPGETTRPEVKP